MTDRVNARLEPDLQKKLAYLRKRTGMSTTEVIRASLESYYEVVRRASEPAQALAGFVGSGDGPVDLSENYKDELARVLARKTR